MTCHEWAIFMNIMTWKCVFSKCSANVRHSARMSRLFVNLLSVVAKWWCFRWIEVIQLTVKDIETKEAHLRHSYHSAWYSVCQHWCTITRNPWRIVQFLLFRPTTTSSHRTSETDSWPTQTSAQCVQQRTLISFTLSFLFKLV